MNNELRYVAQQASDKYYQTYKSDTSFFTLDDFILYCGNAVSDFYQTMWQDKYKELRQDRKDEVVSFDSGILLQQVVSVPDEDKTKAHFLLKLSTPIMSFAYDQNNCGLQTIYYKKTDCDDFDTRAIRSTIFQKDALKRTVICDRIFFYVNDSETVGIVNRRLMPIDELNIYSIPAVSDTMIVPQGIVQKVIDMAIMSLKESHKDVVIKKELGNNSNMVLEGEIDKNSLKP